MKIESVSNFKVLLLETLLKMKELFRQPVYWVTSLLFPSMFYWFFALPHATSTESAHLLLGSFSAFAILGVVFFQTAVISAQEKATPWSYYLKTLPSSSWVRLCSGLAVNCVFATLAVVAVVFTSKAGYGITFSSMQWVKFAGALGLGALPFAVGGFLMGEICTAKNVVPLGNIVYLPLSFAGGLWIPPERLPKVVQDISEYLPTRQFAEVVWAAAFDQELPSASVKSLLLWWVGLSCLWFFARRRK